MSDISGIPNMGIPALSGFNGGGGVNGISGPNGLNDAFAQQAMNNRFFQKQADTLQAAHVPQSQLYGGGFFGAQPAHYAGVGAAYGRATGGFKPPVSPGGGSVFDTGTPAIPYQDAPGPGSFSPSPNYPGGRGGGTVFDTGTSAVPYQNSPPPGSFSPSPNYPGRGRDAIAQAMMPPAPNFNDTFSHFGGPPAHQVQNQPAIDAVNQMSLGGRFNPRVPPSSPPSEAEMGGGGLDFSPIPGGGAGSPGTFADRFAPFMRGNPGTPSEYTTSPYEDVSGVTHQPNIPAGYQTPFSADNPGGALGRGGFRGSQAPIMNSSDGSDTLTAQDTMPPHSFTGPQGTGGFNPSAFDPGQFAPGSPFGSGRGARGGTGTINPPTALPFFGGEGSGFGTPGSTANGGLYAGSGRYPALVGAPNDAYGNPFMQGNAPPFAQGQGRMGGGAGLGGLDLLGQGTVFRGR